MNLTFLGQRNSPNRGGKFSRMLPEQISGLPWQHFHRRRGRLRLLGPHVRPRRRPRLPQRTQTKKRQMETRGNPGRNRSAMSVNCYLNGQSVNKEPKLTFTKTWSKYHNLNTLRRLIGIEQFWIWTGMKSNSWVENLRRRQSINWLINLIYC